MDRPPGRSLLRGLQRHGAVGLGVEALHPRGRGRVLLEPIGQVADRLAVQVGHDHIDLERRAARDEVALRPQRLAPLYAERFEALCKEWIA